MNIFVSNINYRLEEQGLRELFEQYGEVSSAKIIRDRDTNRSKGFGFVEMPDDGHGRVAIGYLNQRDIEGRALVVKEAFDKQR